MGDVTSSSRRTTGARGLPGTVWLLGFVSLLMDSSSELVHALLPVYLVAVLGAGTVALGFVEGLGEATAALLKIISGALSDRMGRRKPLVLLGYGLAALSKPLFPLADTVTTVIVARVVDRVGKGLRGAPRDALIADVTPPPLRGRAYGLRQALDTVGAILGPLAAMLLMFALTGRLRLVLWFAVVPAAACVALLALGVREPRSATTARAGSRPRLVDWRRLPPGFWRVMAIAIPGMLARFGEGFLTLRLFELGLPPAAAPLALLVMNLVYALCAYPAGVLADRVARGRLLAAAFALLVAGDLLLVAARGPGLALAGIALWGLHMAASQGLLQAAVADAAPAHLRGTAFGIFHLASGVMLLAASLIAGSLWQHGSAALAFGFSLLCAVLAGVLAASLLPQPASAAVPVTGPDRRS